MIDLAQKLIDDLAENNVPYKSPPGHPDAVAQGCTCPIVDNGHGRGSGQTDDSGFPLYWINGDCQYYNETQ